MLNITMKYSLLAVTIWGLSACSSPRMITINQENRASTPSPVVVAPTKRPAIKEEILLGQDSKGPGLGSRVDVPMSNPSLGGRIGSYDENNQSESVVESPRVSNEVIERIAFPVNEYRHIKKRGRSTVSGTIYLENSHTSEKIKGQKVKLWLNPVTSYSRQWYQDSYLSGYKLSKTDKRLYNYLKFTYSDRAGNFNFFGLPAGDYYLTGTISCSESCGFNENKSIRLVREISVGSGVTKVDLMKNVP